MTVNEAFQELKNIKELGYGDFRLIHKGEPSETTIVSFGCYTNKKDDDNGGFVCFVTEPINPASLKDFLKNK